MTDPNEAYCTENRRVETTSQKIQTLMEDLQSDLKAERQKTEQLQNALRKLDVELDSIITHGQMSQMMYPTNGWIIDKLRKMKRGLQESINPS